MKYVIESDTKNSLVEIALGFTLFPWLVMLSIGALGHRLDVDFLFKFGFFECVLANIALFPFRGAAFGKKIVRPEN